MLPGEKQNVYKVYDKIAHWYNANRYTGLNEKPYLDIVLANMPANGSLLDIGCGTGKPILEYFVNNDIQVTGVDASSQMLKIAAANFPAVRFIEQDMRLLNLKQKFDAVIAWNSFFHLPVADQPLMFSVFANHLKDGGVLVFTSGETRGEAWGLNGGESLYHASLDAEECNQLLLMHNFSVIAHSIGDPQGGELTVWIARYERK